MIVPTQVGLIVGGVFSIVAPLCIIVTYLRNPLWHRHPNVIVIWKLTFDLLFATLICTEVSLQLAMETEGQPPVLCGHCRWVGALMQFLMFASEMCYFALSYDLLLALRNPFTDYKLNRRFYFAAIVIPALLTSAIIAFSPFDHYGVASGLNEFNLCWIRFQQQLDEGGTTKLNPFLWAVFFAPILVNVLFAVCVLVYAWKRLGGRGLAKTYEQRRQAFRRSLINLLSYAVFWLFAFFLNYSGYVRTRDTVFDPATPSDPHPTPGADFLCEILDERGVTPHTVIDATFTLVFTSKGLIASLVFLWSNPVRRVCFPSSVDTAPLLSAQAQKEAEAELQPHLNTVLREELMHYTRAAIFATVNESARLAKERYRVRQRRARSPPSSTSSASGLRRSPAWVRVDVSRYKHIFRPTIRPTDSPETPVTSPFDSLLRHFPRPSADVNRNVPVTVEDLEPRLFSRIRRMFHITPEAYIESLRSTMKEQFSEGASGAFMCFSHDNRYVIKTCSQAEAETLRRILPDYVRHVQAHRETMLSKYFSCTKMRLYTQTLYFVVMENVFRRCKDEIHERYDLKGSWVNRAGHTAAASSTVHCRYCQEQFKVHNNREACPMRPNLPHVANTLLLDTDLTFKLRLAPDSARRLASQLHWDSEFLMKKGIMDYSLLLGVRRLKVTLKPKNTMQTHEEKMAAREDSVGRSLWTTGGSFMYTSAASTSSHDYSITVSDDEVDGSSEAKGDAAALATGGATQDSREPSDTASSTGSPTSDANRSSRSGGRRKSRKRHSATTDDAESAAHVDQPFYSMNRGGLMPSMIEGPGVFYMGIIDMLQAWTWGKKLERFTKRYLLCSDVQGVSAIPPSDYHARFEKRVIQAIILQHEPTLSSNQLVHEPSPAQPHHFVPTPGRPPQPDQRQHMFIHVGGPVQRAQSDGALRHHQQQHRLMSSPRPGSGAGSGSNLPAVREFSPARPGAMGVRAALLPNRSPPPVMYGGTSSAASNRSLN